MYSKLLAAVLAACALLPATAAAKSPPGFFGVSENHMTLEDFDLLARGDAGVLRTGLVFETVKSAEGAEYQWGAIDYYMHEASSRGIEVLPNLFGVPKWISDERGTVPLGNRELTREWRRFLIASVKRYGPDGDFWRDQPAADYNPITTWQVWNEPNSITWWAPRPDPAEYAVLLQRSAKAIRSVDPNARIMTAGIVARPTNEHAIRGPEYLKRLFAIPGARKATDVLGFHPFAPSVNGVRHQMANARRILDQAGLGDMPIWITEIGWGSRGPEGHPLIKSAEGQVRVLERTFRMILDRRVRLGVEKLIWYHWRDYTDDLCRWCESSGLINRNLGIKALFRAFRDIATPPRAPEPDPIAEPEPPLFPDPYVPTATSAYIRSIR